MSGWRDRLNRMGGRTRFAVCRIFVHLAGDEVAPLLGVLNRAALDAIDAEGDMQVLAEGLVEICEGLLQYDLYWQSAANEGDVFWDEGEAGDYVTELFTDSAHRYGVAEATALDENDPLALPVTQNLVVILTVAYEGEVPALETDLANISALKAGLKALINLRYDNKLRAIQWHYSPAQLGDVLTSEQLILNFPELIPL
ncbi:DUF1517 domain-containing protein [Leptolyngbya sp. NK1-12]|uniref:DUF1517 domain-containing protein n=1 Tax=Leptolyngbya sp. NK1-12 TaxID=2547451 RepID=A0AA96WJD1_9CYAN|nr:DUF1517 domain-containing protein [Leptolyngbya sp. NK1-12]